ncbi:hypothetical protein KIMH_06600 [Bombiscardovia apis]|uniref:Uncharacterized protein n=1 Tax=Bombiscardovia apis TaxID=2932182 RepID=A0ABN6SFS0_9BIFI|nr:hypothetical protein KIMH_06600 [Bombiscardovia apis]
MGLINYEDGKEASTSDNINVNELNFTETVENHLNDLNKAGDKVRLMVILKIFTRNHEFSKTSNRP